MIYQVELFLQSITLLETILIYKYMFNFWVNGWIMLSIFCLSNIL